MEKDKPLEVRELEDWYGVSAERKKFGWVVKGNYGTTVIYSDSFEDIEEEIIRNIRIPTNKKFVGKQIPFNKFWERLIEKLDKPTMIKNWTVFSGYLGEDFEAIAHSKVIIKCTLHNGRQLFVPREDFRIVYKKWNDYLAGEVRRSEFTKKSRLTKYTISIIHQFEELTYQ